MIDQAKTTESETDVVLCAFCGEPTDGKIMHEQCATADEEERTPPAEHYTTIPKETE